MPKLLPDPEYANQEKVKFPDVLPGDCRKERNDRVDARILSWIAEFKRTMKWKLDDFIPNAYDADCVNLDTDYSKWEAAVSSGQLRMNFVDYLVFKRNAVDPESSALDESVDLEFCSQLRSQVRKDADALYSLTAGKFHSLISDSDTGIGKLAKKIDANANRLRPDSNGSIGSDDTTNSDNASSECESDSNSGSADSASSTNDSFASEEDYVQTRLPNGEYCMRPLSDLAEFFVAEAQRLIYQGAGNQKKVSGKIARRAFRAACRSFKENSFVQNCMPQLEEDMSTTMKVTGNTGTNLIVTTKKQTRPAPENTNLTTISTAQRMPTATASSSALPKHVYNQELQLTQTKPPVTAKQQRTRADAKKVSNETVYHDAEMPDASIRPSVTGGNATLMYGSVRSDRPPIFQSTPFFTAPYAVAGGDTTAFAAPLDNTRTLRSRARVHPAAKQY